VESASQSKLNGLAASSLQAVELSQRHQAAMGSNRAVACYKGTGGKSPKLRLDGTARGIFWHEEVSELIAPDRFKTRG
jgi:hypothetical protein